MRPIELLIPAGDLETLKVGVHYGADAIYVGGTFFGLRAKANKFDKEKLIEAREYCHKYGVKLFITVNITAHNEDLEKLPAYIQELNEVKPDAVIVSDPGVFTELKADLDPEIEIHISTQANNVNYAGFKFWHKLGAKRVVCARELSLKEIKGIRENIPDDLDIETFVHGAMCMAYSGRCLISNFLTGRDANKGECTHPCRWKYHVVEENRPGEYMPIIEEENGTYLFNSKDLCMIEHIPDLVDAGIDSFKIEGRMKTALYVATVARTYRLAIDAYLESEEKYTEMLPYFKEEIGKCTYRSFTTGFFYGKPLKDAHIYDNNDYIKDYIYLGYVEEITEDGYCRFSQRNKFSVGETIEIMKPNGENIITKVVDMLNENKEQIEACPHPKKRTYVKLDTNLEISEFDVMRKEGIDRKQRKLELEGMCASCRE